MYTKKAHLGCWSYCFFERGTTLNCTTSIAATHKSTNDRRKSESSTKYHHRIAERPSIKKRLLSFFRFRYYYYPSGREGAVGNAIICPGEISKHCIRPTWHSKHFRKPAKKIGGKNYLQTWSFLYAMLVIRYYWMMKFCFFKTC